MTGPMTFPKYQPRNRDWNRPVLFNGLDSTALSALLSNGIVQVTSKRRPRSLKRTGPFKVDHKHLS